MLLQRQNYILLKSDTDKEGALAGVRPDRFDSVRQSDRPMLFISNDTLLQKFIDRVSLTPIEERGLKKVEQREQQSRANYERASIVKTQPKREAVPKPPVAP